MKQIHEYQVAMTCEGCSGAVQRVLGKINDGSIEKVDISLEKQSVKVTTNKSKDEIFDIIKKTGKTVNYVSSNVLDS